MTGHPTADESPALRIQLLGGFTVAVGDRRIDPSAWRRRKVRALIALLALAPGHALHREQVMDQLWPDHAPEAAANSLYQTLHLARRTLAPSGADARYLVLRDEVLRLAPEAPAWVDVEAFEAAAAATLDSQVPAAYRAALDLYTGDLLPEDRYAEWASQRREALRRRQRGLLIDLAAAYAARDEHISAIAALQHLVASDPADEEAQRALMRLYMVSGQRLAALRQYQLLRTALDSEMAVEPDALTEDLHQQILAGRLAGAHPPPTPFMPYTRDLAAAQHLPIALTSFIGRKDELAELRRLLGTTHMLTLVGPGGCGKTRLALEIAGQLRAAYPDGVWLVELAAMVEPALVAQVVAEALGVRETPAQPPAEALVAALRPRQLLLVLDNCEHVIDACAQLSATLLRACPRLSILATSREPLHITGERTWRVPPLALPDPRRLPPLEDLMGYAAISLFVERATTVAPSFTLNPQNAAVLAQLCASLDGLPLAIELAAAQMRVLSIAQLSDRLGERLRLLRADSRTAPRRQQTLRATLDWSYDLLSDPERRLYARLAVFAGGFDLEAAEVERNAILYGAIRRDSFARVRRSGHAARDDDVQPGGVQLRADIHPYRVARGGRARRHIAGWPADRRPSGAAALA